MGMDDHFRLDPFRALDWRWALAELIFKQACDRTDLSDAAILTAVDYLEASPACRARRRKFAAIRAAERLRCADGPKLWEIQSRLVAGQSDEAIERSGGAPAPVVGWYEALFFHVRDLLYRKVALQRVAVGYGSLGGFAADDLGGFWRWMASAGSPELLTHIVDWFHAARRPQDAPRLDVYIRPGSPAPLELQALVALSLIPLDENTASWRQSHRARVFAIQDLSGVSGARARTALQRETIEAARDWLAGRELKDRAKAKTSNTSRTAGARADAHAVVGLGATLASGGNPPRRKSRAVASRSSDPAGERGET